MSEKKVKLKLYHNVGEKTYIDSIEAETFDEFVLVHVDDGDIVSVMSDQLIEMFPDKKVVVIPKSWDISFYGVEVDNDN